MLSLTIQFAYLIHVLKRQKDILHRQSIYARKDQQIKKTGMIIKTAEWHVFSKQFSRLFTMNTKLNKEKKLQSYNPRETQNI